MYYKGLCHLFYQYNPKAAVWGNIVWAHSVSKDLLNWQSLELAITPTAPFDIKGCWSGLATILPGYKPVLFYTGIDLRNNEVQNYAVPENASDPYLRKWNKPSGNSIMVADKGMNARDFRDATTAWQANGYWNLLVGSKSDRTDFYPVSKPGKKGLDTSVQGKDVKHVLKVSFHPTRYEHYTLGTDYPNQEKYVPDKDQVDGWAGLRSDYGNIHASKTFFDPAKSRRTLSALTKRVYKPTFDGFVDVDLSNKKFSLRNLMITLWERALQLEGNMHLIKCMSNTSRFWSGSCVCIQQWN
ncbi:hypothetical protein QUC31_010909 [Theobroma cacao]